MKQVSFFGLQTIPEVKSGDDLAATIFRSCLNEGAGLIQGDVVLITSKVVSKAEGRVGRLSEVKPSRRARAISKLTGKDPVEVELILSQSANIPAAIPVAKIGRRFAEIFASIASGKDSAGRALQGVPTMLITQTDQGTMVTDAGLDYSNNPLGWYSLLPADPNGSARRLREGLSRLTGCELAVVITDTELTFTHIYGSTDIAIGYAGILPVSRRFGAQDRYGREKFGGADVVVDELPAASSLLARQTSESIPVVIVRGLEYERGNGTNSGVSVPPGALGAGV